MEVMLFSKDGSNGGDDNYYSHGHHVFVACIEWNVGKVKVEKVTQKSDGRQPKVTHLKPLP